MRSLFSWFHAGDKTASAAADGGHPRAVEKPPAAALPQGASPGLSLYHFESCPFCVRVRRAMKSLGLDIELRDVRGDRSRYEELIREGGSSQVPCLRIENETGEVTWLYESSDIIRFLEAQIAGT